MHQMHARPHVVRCSGHQGFVKPVLEHKLGPAPIPDADRCVGVQGVLRMLAAVSIEQSGCALCATVAR